MNKIITIAIVFSMCSLSHGISYIHGKREPVTNCLQQVSQLQVFFFLQNSGA